MPRRTRKQLLVAVRSLTWQTVVAFLFLIIVAIVLVSTSVQHAFFGETIANLFASKRALGSKIITLETSIQGMESNQSELQLLRSENDMLKAQLGRNDHHIGILATVLFVPGRSLYNTFVIDAGSAEGITTGAEVYAFDTILLGKITAFEDHRATVTLLSAAGTQTAGTSIPDNTAVTLIGRGGGEYEIHMPRDIRFDIGQVIAAQSTMPTVLATVVETTADPRDPFQKIRVKAPINLQQLKWVIVR